MSTSPLPDLYQRWVSQIVATDLPSERRATCLDCAMCGDAAGAATAFRPDTKCCTYIPALPNFVVGAVLADESPEASHGRATLLARIARVAAVTPIGVDLTDAELALYEVERQHLGRSLHVRCPHYIEDGGLCGIWRHRNAVCSTWFCKHERGATGFTLWRAVETTLAIAEEALAHWCVLELDPGPEALATSVIRERRKSLRGLPSPSAYRTAWGRWYARESEFFINCHRLVSELSWQEVLAIGGAPLQAAARVLASCSAAYAAPIVPARTHLVPLRVLGMTAETSYVSTYSPHDIVALPTQLLGVLRAFDGRDTQEALATIERDHELAVADELVIKLVDFDVLASASSSEPESA
jgi:Fe-S-cluster containining protein